MNVTEIPYISITEEQRDHLLSMTKMGIENMDKAGVRLIPELRLKTNTRAVHNARNNRISNLEHSKEEFKGILVKDDAKKKAARHRGPTATSIMNACRDRSVQIKNIVSVFAGADVTAKEQSIASSRVAILDKYVDLISPFPEPL